MDVPEKIILSQDKDTKELLDYWLLEDRTDNIKVEYVRTDIFIEKAAKFIRDNVELNKYKSSDEESYRVGCPYDYFETENFIRDFKDYMKKWLLFI